MLFATVGDGPDHPLKGIFKECENNRNGVEAYRLLRMHCDPTTYSTAGIMMDDILETARLKPKDLDELIINIRNVISKVLKYEA